MTEPSTNKNYTAADFERYHAGKMPAAEMHALEKAAMEDPFLADALEGFAYATTPVVDIQKIREKLFGEEERRKTVPFFYKNYNWLKAAAIVIFIAGGSWLAVQMLGNKQSSMALETPEQNKPAETTTQNNEIVNRSVAVLPDSVQQSTATVDKKSVTRSQTVIESPNANFATPLSDETVTANKSVTVEDANESVVKNNAEEKLKDQNTVTVIETDKYKKTQSNATFNQSTSNQNNAVVYKGTLPGYNNSQVYRKDKNDSARDYYNTDLMAKKEFKSASTDSIKNLNIVLQPDNTGLSEVVVSSGKTPVRQQEMQIKVDTLEPADGWRKFDEYIANNIKVPDELKTKQYYSGEVELSFDINKKGEPVNIAVTKSLCEKCDEEAIRLLKEGPKWKKKKEKKGKVVIKF